MEFLLAALALPILLAALSLGAGLLVDRAAGGVLPLVLIPVVGLAGLIATAELTTYWGATAPLTPYVVLAVAVVGGAVGWRRLSWRRSHLWGVGASVAVFVIVAAPALLAGRATLAGYLLDTTVAFHIAGAEYLVQHGRDFARLPESSYQALLAGYAADEYPSGGQVLLGSLAALLRTDAIWIYQTLIACLLAFLALPIFYLARSVAMPRWAAAGSAVVASVPALVYSYAQMGAIKEMAVLSLVMLLGALLVALPRFLAAGPRGALPVAVAGAGGMAAIGLPFVGWLGPALLIGLVLATTAQRTTPRALAGWVAVLAVALVVLNIPTLGPLSASVNLASNLSQSNTAFASDPGNLTRPLLPAQAAGVWLGGSHRGDPPHLTETYVLIGIVAAMALLGVLLLWRRRAWPLIVFAAMMAVVWLVLTRRGTDWTDAKLLVILSPLVVLLAAVGVESLRQGGRRVEAATLAVVVAGGVLLSSAFTYHDTNLLPTDRYEEALAIGERFAGQGPALLPEFDEFALYALRDTAPSGPGFSQRGPVISETAAGGALEYARSYDLDELDAAEVGAHPLIIRRRRPDVSRPSASYELAFEGDYYEVWRRRGDVSVLSALPIGGAGQPVRIADCSDVAALTKGAPSDALLAYPRREPPIVVNAEQIEARSVAWPALGGVGLGLTTPGRLETPIIVPRDGRYRVWLRGDFARPLTVLVDGEKVGEVAYESGNDGNFASPLEVDLTAGRHLISVERGGGGLAPGDGSFSRLASIVVEEAEPVDAPLASVASDDWRALCGRELDWVDVLR